LFRERGREGEGGRSKERNKQTNKKPRIRKVGSGEEEER
jgi:hypothetical protein